VPDATHFTVLNHLFDVPTIAVLRRWLGTG
jgi:hypothetical protein